MIDESAPQTTTPLEIPVVIDSLRISKQEDRKVVVLFDCVEKQYLPIWIGSKEGEVLLSELQSIPHEKCTAFIDQLVVIGKPKKALVCNLINNVYKAMMILEQDNHEAQLGMRPSDALAVAVRLQLPIVVSSSVMQAAARPEPSHNLILKVISFIEGILEKFNSSK